MMRGSARLAVLVTCGAALLAPAGASALRVTWMKGVASPGTPARYDRVGVIRVGPAAAPNVLVLEPGTSAGASYFVPLARWLTSTTKGWQVFDYYLGYLTDPSITRHVASLPTSRVGFARRWGMSVAVGDLHRVIAAALRRGGRVVLGGHSLGGAVVTAYATWDFHGRAGADELAGLVYDDGASGPPETAARARAALRTLDAPDQTPWLSFGGIPAPFAGLYETTGALSALIAPEQPSLGQRFSLLPAELKPSVPVTNRAQYGYALNVGTSPASLTAAQGHLGKGISPRTINGAHTWDGSGALTPITRFATMFSGRGVSGADGVEWYFPQRLTDDTAAVGNGIANPAQRILGVHATMGRRLPRDLRIYAFGAALGGRAVPAAAVALARQSGIPPRNLTLIDRHSTYAHNDPAGAYPRNVFFTGLVRFLRGLGAHR